MALALDELLTQSAALHKHLCPRQVLGVRMGLQGGALLGLSVPQSAKRLLTIVETDGCFADGVSAATNCWVGRRTLRVEDLGKVAATFVDTQTGRALRVWPRHAVRERAQAYAPEADNRWQGQLLGYQRMPVEALLTWCEVRLRADVALIVSRPGLRAACDHCGEEILNGREIRRDDQVLCGTCADRGYYELCYSASSLTSVRSHGPSTVKAPRSSIQR